MLLKKTEIRGLIREFSLLELFKNIKREQSMENIEQMNTVSISNEFNTNLLLNEQLHPIPIRIGIVAKEQEIYIQGRNLANEMYAKIWDTKSLIDDNDFGIVVFCSGQVVGNVNLQIKHSESNLLHSEIFFTQKHWQQYLDIPNGQLAEISGLCVSDTVPQSLSRPIIMGLVLGLHLLHNSLQIRYLTTVQHEYLIRVLCKSLNLPFFCNETITYPQGQVPDDGYWKRDKSPRIYYIDGYSADTIKAVSSLFCYLNMVGYQIHVEQKISPVNLSYTYFWSKWTANEISKIAF